MNESPDTVTIGGRAFKVVSHGAPVAAVKRKAHRAIPKPLDGKPVSRGTLTLSTAPPSVNGLFANRKNGKGRIKTLSYRNWRSFADREIRDQPSWHVAGKVRIFVRVGGSRCDSDNMLKATLDSLVTAGRIAGDSPKYVLKSSIEHDPAIVGTLIMIEGVAA